MKYHKFIKLAVIGVIFFLILSGLSLSFSAETVEQKTDNPDEAEAIPTDEPTMIVQGHVLDGEAEKGIPGAFLLFFNDVYKFRTTTNEEGFFIIELPAGSYHVYVDADGYLEIRESVAGRPDQVVKVEYYMKPGEPDQPPDDRPPEPDNEQRPPPPPKDTGDEDDINIERNDREKNIAEMFSGGDSVIIRSGNSDDFIAVIYGTREQPNSITILAYYTRYIGAGDIYDENGVLIGSNEPIAVKTIYMQTFEHIIEFNDTNSDGLYKNIDRLDLNTESKPLDPEFKMVSLFTSWTLSEVKESSFRDNNKEYQFELTSKNLNYRFLNDQDNAHIRMALELVKFKFHIYMKTDETSRNDIPAFKVEVEAGSEGEIQEVLGAEFREHRTYEGKRTATKVKYDYTIGGWDFDRSNKAPRLFLDMNMAMLHSTDDPIAQWMNRMHFDEAFRFQDRFQFKDADGFNNEFFVQHHDEENYELIEEKEPDENTGSTRATVVENTNEEATPAEDTSTPAEDTATPAEDTATPAEDTAKPAEDTAKPAEDTAKTAEDTAKPAEDTAKPAEDTAKPAEEVTLKEFKEPVQVEDNQLKFIDNMYQLGSFSWVNNVTADGKDLRIKFQLQWIEFIKKNFDKQVFTGFLVKGGFSLPAAQRIHHDPTFASDFYELEIGVESVEIKASEPGTLTISVSILLIIITIILIAFYISVNAKKDKKMHPPKLPTSNGYTVMEKDTFQRKKKTEEDEYYESYYVDWDD